MHEYSTMAIDGMNVFKAVYATHKDLVTQDNIPTGGIIGFLTKLRNLQKEFKAQEILILWEGGGTWRNAVLKEYKGTRIRSDDPDEGNQMEAVRQVTQLIPNVCSMDALGMEADDIAGHLFRRHEHFFRNSRLLLVSNDKDWLQLVGLNTDVLRFSSKNLVTLENFSEHADGAENPKEFLEMKCLIGDAGDNVPGVRGVGPKTALNYLRGNLKTSAKAAQRIDQWYSDPQGYERSRDLMDLRKELIDIDIQSIPARPNNKTFTEHCENYEFNRILQQGVEQWLSVFST